ncbi:ATP-binding cassette subfamily B protein [Clostridium tetanomorphum]|uniref:ABC transporter ATP-binding protein n=1 Tax=Clostridium tetanomorphum TaxID=1553 RepID=A0A923J228_CLOTT|nr:ABC transporter ATP-binding protein [Clostridium tetanomorphum]KAJ48962.1 multidrug resistance ABC transporter ATP-binding and permease protein [Clostridium tetanomorphum DSM 665]KAJ51321.1 multidrug resistance ABC transporter ATP-binding and permease protein [Clostridium tetanomorphum DSM 665]MBC2399822.1 ABC transporter ATP-binding protein [Clostridium tetanomorphum]MBP1865986.1 ATP-binding cassette subfamily B protein [Clostridium tetanomorphum]NRS85960.1 ATP-binding cassette subfamily B
MKTIKKFISYYKPYKRMFFIDMLCALVLSAIDLIFPIIVRYLLYDVYNKSREQIIKYIILIGSALLLMYVIRYLCQYYITAWGHIMGARMEADMRRDIFNHLQKLSFSYYDNTNTGKLMSRIVTDLFDISELAHHGPEDVFISLLKIIGSFIILMNINVNITVVLIFITLFIIYFSYFYNKKMKLIFKRNREKIADVNAQIQDSLSGIRVVKSFSNEHIEKRKFQMGNNEFLETKEIGYGIMGRFFSMNGFFQGILYLSAILLGGIFIGNGKLQTYDLVVYILYINIFLNPIEKLINFTEQYQKGITGFERFLEIISTNPDITENKDAVEFKNPKGNIQFNNVSFSYDNKNSVLNNINVDIEAGKTVAIVGPSGSGKTTFCNVIPRFYEVDEGSILLDGIDIRNIKLKSLRNNIGIVQQDVYMFSGTIKENIAYGNPEATEEEIIEAAKRANAHEFIMNLDDEYNTYVGERGVRLSGGQKQRICIARVFLKNPPILILDEATSALDNESEKLIQKSLEILSKNRTTIVIAHRLSTIKNADEIILLTDEGIKERGSHNDLINKKGMYMNLYNMQFQ